MMIENDLEGACMERKQKKKKNLVFSTWKLDFYSFAVDLTIEPGYWITFIIRTGRRVFKCEYTFVGGK